VPPRLKIPLALCLVALFALTFYFSFGVREGLLTLTVGMPSFFLGAFVGRGKSAAGDRVSAPHADKSRQADARRETANGSAPAGALLEATMNGMREGVLVVNDSLRVVSANNAAMSVFGRGGEALAGQPLSALTRNPAINAAYRAAVERREDTQVKVELVGADRRVLELRVAPLEVEDACDAIGVFFDITELERLERVRQEFLSNVSHELRTPLTSILAFVETLEDGALEETETARRFLSVIRRNSERMHTLIEDILELSAIESGASRVEARPVRLAHLIQEVLSALAAKADACGVALVNGVAPEAFVYADPRRLEQMLLNLVDNAVKFSRRGGSVNVGYEQGARDLVSVTDSGEGIPAEHLPRIFERFYRVDSARSREMGGTGLGLAIVKHLARAHGGEVRVHSVWGEGSTFTVELPRETPAESSAA
jgi:two-component system phosphate regulon sensor histidine kinase PhoR